MDILQTMLTEGTKLLIATHNGGKKREMNALLSGLALTLVGLNDVKCYSAPEETATTFIGNAKLKAQYYAATTGLWSLADDSGLEIDKLGGEPGVYSARYGGSELSGEERCQLVLDKLAGVPTEERIARFKSVAVLCSPKGAVEVVCDGCLEGRIAPTFAGDKGFGYDPIFWVDEFNATVAMLEPAVKNRISHRGQAMDCMVKALSELMVAE